MARITDLPPEILNEVIEHFAETLDAKQARHIMPQCTHREFEYLQHTFRPAPKFADRKTLVNLRLTCRFLNAATIPVMFGFMNTMLRGVDAYWETGQPKMFTDIISGKSDVHQYIKKLHVDLYNSSFWFHGDSKEPYLEDHVVNPLPAIIKALPKLQSLRIEVIDRVLQSEFFEQGKILPLEKVENVVRCLATSLSDSSLSTHLTSLHLCLFCTHDFEVIAQSASNEVMGNIRNLYIEIMDGTGPGGAFEYDSLNVNHPDYENETKPSNLQQKHHNLRHQQGVFDLIAKCPKLQKLGVVGTHHLDLDLLDWSRESSNLEVLYLARVRVSHAKLLQILSPVKGQSSSSFGLSRIQFTQVELKGGYWKDILNHLALMPSMRYFSSSYLDYTLNGESASLRLGGPYVWTDLDENILSNWPVDIQSLNDLWRILVRKAGGIGPGKYPHEPDQMYGRPGLHN